MFQGYSSRSQQRATNTVAQRRQNMMTDSNLYARKLYPIYSASMLLNSDKRRRLLTEIRGLLAAPDDTFDEYCLPLIHGIAELAQELPAKNEITRFDYPGGLLDFMLERCSATLRSFQNYLANSNAANYILEQPIVWGYTLFSVALLQHIGVLVSHYHFTLFNENKESIGAFSPFDGTMSNHGTFYQAIYDSKGDIQERNTATLLLARQLMPTVGLNWINQFNEAFHFWAITIIGDTVDQDGRSGGGPIQILTDALERILNRSLPGGHPGTHFFDEQLHSDSSEHQATTEAEKQSLATLIDKNTNDTRVAQAFLNDLADRIDLSGLINDDRYTSPREDKIPVNSRAAVHVVNESGGPVWFVSFTAIANYARLQGIGWQHLVQLLGKLGAIRNHYAHALLSMGLGASRSISGFTLKLPIDAPAEAMSTTLTLNASITAQQSTSNMQGDAWPSKSDQDMDAQQRNNPSQNTSSTKW